MSDTPPKSVLLDTDIGSDVDDVLALGLILASPEELSLVAITTVCGDTELRGQIAAGVLARAGRSDIDVCAGETSPVLRHPERYAWYGHEKLCLPEEKFELSLESGPERIVRAANEVSDLDLIAIGPMTNLARALVLDPGLPRKIRSLTVMGGHIRQVMIGSHICAPGVDYNFCSDPEATMAVLGAGFPIALVTADVTLRTWINSRDLEAMEAGGPVSRLMAEQVRIWSPVQRDLFTGIGGTMAPDNEAFLHDPLAVQALIDPSAIRFETLRILPTIQGGLLRTLEMSPDSEAGCDMKVATSVDAKVAARAISERLRSV